MNAPEVLQRFGDLPFDVEIELGDLAITVRELFDLQEGMVLRTGHPAGVPFTLRAGGAELATAEIVVIGEALSARVKNLAPKPKTVAGEDGTD
jgi:flagellar motor switch/type III secretory pathway protein FliN